MRNLTTLAIAMLVAAQAAAGQFLFVGSEGTTSYSFDAPSTFFTRYTTHSPLPTLKAHDTVFGAQIEIDTVDWGATDGIYAHRSKAQHTVTFTVEWVRSSRGEKPPRTITMTAQRKVRYGIVATAQVNTALEPQAPMEFELSGQIYSETINQWWGPHLDVTFALPNPPPQTPSWGQTAVSGDPYFYGAWLNEYAPLPAKSANLEESPDGRFFYRASWSYYDEYRGLPTLITDPNDRAWLVLTGSQNGWAMSWIGAHAQTRISLTSPTTSN